MSATRISPLRAWGSVLFRKAESGTDGSRFVGQEAAVESNRTFIMNPAKNCCMHLLLWHASELMDQLKPAWHSMENVSALSSDRSLYPASQV